MVFKYKNYCKGRKVSFPITDKDVHICAEFLCYLADGSERPSSTLKSAMAALSCFYRSVDLSNPFQDYHIHQLVTALVKSGTVIPGKRTPIMDIETFIQMFSKWEDNEKLSLAKLRLKTITLLAFVIMARPSDLAPKAVNFGKDSLETDMVLFSTDNVTFHDDGSLTVNLFGIKNDTDRSGFEVKVPKGSIPKVDPVVTLAAYITRTDSIRPVGNPVFLSLNKPYRAVKSDTIAGDLQRAINLAGLKDKGYSAKSFRPSGATAAVRSGIDPNTVMQLGRWKTSEVFYNHYVYPKAPDNYTDVMIPEKYSA